jgi:protein-S-isoprenylcysteine O-methyltransferase Ste14
MAAAVAALRRSLILLRQPVADFRVVISFLLLSVFLIRQGFGFADDQTAESRNLAYLAFGWCAVAVGAWLRSWSAGVLRKGCDLTTSGPYSVCRHPLYLGSFLLLVGFCHLLGRPAEYGPIVAVIGLVHLVTMHNEEIRLAVKFGDRWTDYARQTPMFVPWRLGSYSAARWSIRQWLRAREYRALATSAFGVFALELLR